MNIGFEAKRIFTNFTGLGNYGRFIVGSLSTHFPEHNYFLYTPRISNSPEVLSLSDRANVRIIKPEGIFSKGPLASVWRTWGVGSHKTVAALSIFHGLSQELPVSLPRNVKKVVTVHDLIFLRYPKLYNPIDAKIYLAKVKRACDNADRIVAISEQTAIDIQDRLGISGERIRVVYQGCNPAFYNRASNSEIQQVRDKYGLPTHYALSVGTIEERKNILLLVRAMSRIPESKRIPVVVVGRQTSYFKVVSEEVARLGLTNWFIFLPNASFADFPALYQSAHMFVYPSLFEGFGIPLIEAIASGIPVITSKGSCFLEAAGPGSVYVDPLDPADLATQLQRVSEGTDLRNSMVTQSHEFIKRFDSHQIATATMNVYRELS
jgi:glycosyltransferase involved in cell wall biosynthesis